MITGGDDRLRACDDRKDEEPEGKKGTNELLHDFEYSGNYR